MPQLADFQGELATARPKAETGLWDYIGVNFRWTGIKDPETAVFGIQVNFESRHFLFSVVQTWQNKTTNKLSA